MSVDNHEESRCNDEDRSAVVRSVLDRIGDKWSVIVIRRLGPGPCRSNEPRREADGITQRMLSTTLRGLERDGVVSQAVHPTVPPRVDYALTATGHALLQIVSVQQVKARYVRFVDEKKCEEVAELFTPEVDVVTDGTTWDSGTDLANVVRDLGHG
ncbi:winged helix-turn-helix transcriptional regulator [Streptomyces sp. NPDC058683]|uniref:winged helix-turn-helix transcriptional regulator n=1 Tax=Streptomyces sp. NPDC058683 TaxID=3346597 RepID=UPI003664CC05